ncbi:MAG TPA: hypothetical protein VF041_16115 [Gemmatimonadaceae bacterium]
MRGVPDPAAEIRVTALRTLRGASYWSVRPVTYMALVPGAYDEISSADVPGVTDALRAALPALEEHQCSVGRRGGFITRLRRGTYAPHIVEHVALELQRAIGHAVGYGRTRGGDEPGAYSVVIEHRHAGVGARAAALAVELVRRAFAGTLSAAHARQAIAELAAVAALPDAPPLDRRVRCAITGGAERGRTREALARLGLASSSVVDVAPARILRAGLPYACSEVAIVLDAELVDVPPRYREPDRARRLVATLACAVRRGGTVIAPAGELEIHEMARSAGCRVVPLDSAPDRAERAARMALASLRERGPVAGAEGDA